MTRLLVLSAVAVVVGLTVAVVAFRSLLRRS
jgi:hypothetical protein